MAAIYRVIILICYYESIFVNNKMYLYLFNIHGFSVLGKYFWQLTLKDTDFLILSEYLFRMAKF